jgi:GNAT superfamily N-acetyltransferase
MDFSTCKLIRLTDNQVLKPFDCGREDVNSYLFDGAKSYDKQFLSVTYLMENATDTVAFVALTNDRITLESTPITGRWKKYFYEYLPIGKRYISYPAVKIVQLGVSRMYQRSEVGTAVIDFVKKWLMNNRFTGCRFLTVEGIKESLPFYEKNGFYYMTNDDVDSDTRIMYYDLKRLEE